VLSSRAVEVCLSSIVSPHLDDLGDEGLQGLQVGLLALLDDGAPDVVIVHLK